MNNHQRQILLLSYSMKQKIGLALGSGGWRGLSHIGVIKSLIKNDIPIDFISGCSIGSIIGGIYAATGDIQEVEKIVNSLNFKKFIKLSFSKRPPTTAVFSRKFKNFFYNTIGHIDIKDLKIPFIAVGSDITTGNIIEFKKGDLVTAMLASSGIPFLLGPSRISDKFIFDGGMINPIPIQTVKEMGADISVGVSLYGGVFPISQKISKIKAIKASRFLYLKRLADIDLQQADLAIDLKIPDEDFSFFSKFSRSKELINFGFRSTQKILSTSDFISQVK